MQTSLRSATASPYGHEAVAVPASRCIALWSDDPAALPAWRESLRGEGLHAVDLDAPGTDPEAIVLRVTHGLSEQLARLRDLRKQAPFTPLLVACQPLRDLDQVLALEMGADDVLDAGWGAAVLAARLRSLWRCTAKAQGALASGADALRFGTLLIRLREREVIHAGNRVPLTEGEFEVLWLLASHAGAALSRRDILRRVRGLDDQPLDRSIDSRVYRIRAKLADNDSAHQRIRTVRNRGYLFSPVGW
jgi:two-component system, OmpR family, response regulator RstA